MTTIHTFTHPLHFSETEDWAKVGDNSQKIRKFAKKKLEEIPEEYKEAFPEIKNRKIKLIRASVTAKVPISQEKPQRYLYEINVVYDRQIVKQKQQKAKV